MRPDVASLLRRAAAGFGARARGWLHARKDLADLSSQVASLEEHIANLALALAGTAAGRSEAQATHRATALRYRQFLDQDLMSALHRARAETPAAEPARTRWSAELGRDICAGIFAAPVVSRAALGGLLAGPLADQLAATGRQLRASVAALPGSPWQFTCAGGTPLDPEYQDPWSDCDPAAPARWVVAPAYVADGQVVVRQRVYTCP